MSFTLPKCFLRKYDSTPLVTNSENRQVVRDGGADLNRRGACQENSTASRQSADSAAANDGHIRQGFMNIIHAPQGNRLNGCTRQSTSHVA